MVIVNMEDDGKDEHSDTGKMVDGGGERVMVVKMMEEIMKRLGDEDNMRIAMRMEVEKMVMTSVHRKIIQNGIDR